MAKNNEQPPEPTCDYCKKRLLVAFSDEKSNFHFCGKCNKLMRNAVILPYKGKLMKFDELPITKETIEYLRLIILDFIKNCKKD
jgi:hypothetical protein